MVVAVVILTVSEYIILFRTTLIDGESNDGNILPYSNHYDKRTTAETRSVIKESSLFANETAIVIRTRYPFASVFLDKIFSYSKELFDTKSKYELIILLDTSKLQQEQIIIKNTTTAKEQSTSSSPENMLQRYYNMFNQTIPIPFIYEVHEDMLLQEFPKLTNFLYNDNPNEPNFNNKPGLCCGNSIMWQLLIPTFVMMYKNYNTDTNYQQKKYMWCIEDDIDTIGSRTLLEMIQLWDIALQTPTTTTTTAPTAPTTPTTIDLAAITLNGAGVLQKGSAKRLHTPSFHKIVDQMMMSATTKNNNQKDRTSSQSLPYILFDRDTPWTSMSDAIHRYSFPFVERLHDRIRSNTFAWAETFVHPIAWEGNYAVVDLRQILLKDEDFEIYSIDRHKDRNEVLQHLWDDDATTQENFTKKKKKKTVIFHGPTLDTANHWTVQ
jgi:hypothetical protein